MGYPRGHRWFTWLLLPAPSDQRNHKNPQTNTSLGIAPRNPPFRSILSWILKKKGNETKNEKREKKEKESGAAKEKKTSSSTILGLTCPKHGKAQPPGDLPSRLAISQPDRTAIKHCLLFFKIFLRFLFLFLGFLFLQLFFRKFLNPPKNQIGGDNPRLAPIIEGITTIIHLSIGRFPGGYHPSKTQQPSAIHPTRV